MKTIIVATSINVY